MCDLNRFPGWRKVCLTAFALVFLSIFSGCAQKYGFQVDGLSRSGFVAPPAAAVSYVLESADPAIKDGDLRFEELRGMVGQALQKKGYQRAADASSADLVILIASKLSDPLTTTRSYSEPLYHYRGGYNRVVRTPVLNDQGKVVRYAYSEVRVPSRSYLAGYVPQTKNVTVYEKVLYLSARESLAPNGEPGNEVWTVSVRSKNTSSDLRAYLPYMIAAAYPHLGERTNGEIEVILEEDDPSVHAFR